MRHATGSSRKINTEKNHLKYKTTTVAKSQTLSSGPNFPGKQTKKFTENSVQEKCQSKGRHRKLVKPQTVTSKGIFYILFVSKVSKFIYELVRSLNK